jgi:hypothetical protein
MRKVIRAPWETPRIAGGDLAELSIFRPFPGPVDVQLAHARAFDTGAVLHVYSNPRPRDRA